MRNLRGPFEEPNHDIVAYNGEMRAALYGIRGAIAAALLLGLVSGCENWRYDYADARAAKTRYKECLKDHPKDPGACDSLRSDASSEYGDYKEKARRNRGCETDRSLCR